VSRPRILQLGKFYPPYMGGIETHLETLCGELRAFADVTVLAANTSNDRVEEHRDGVTVIRLPPRFWMSTAPLCPSIAGEIRRLQPDLIHLHLPHPGGMLGLLASRSRAPLVVTYHSDVVRQQWRAAPFTPILHATLRRAHTIVATSRAYVESSPVLTRFERACRVVPYGIPLARFNGDSARDAARLRERCGGRMVLAIGRLVYYKGFDVLVDAMRQVDGHLVLVGDGPLRSSLESRATTSGVHRRITFVGETPNEALGPYYAAARVFVLPSVARSEAFGIVQIEALASGIPVVNTRLASGVPEVSLHGVTGLTVPPGDVAALARAIGSLLDDPDLSARFGAAGRERAASEFTHTRMGERLRTIYAEALAEARF
jgi:glycosyltransferase involved in cell wall biosynthesis